MSAAQRPESDKLNRQDGSKTAGEKPRPAAVPTTREPRVEGDDPIIDDGRTLSERELESNLAASHGSRLPGVVDDNGEKRLVNDPDDATLDVERDAGVIVRRPRSRDELSTDSNAPVPPPPRRD